MGLFLYNSLLLLGCLAGAPLWLGLLLRRPKHRAGLPERLGWVPARLRMAGEGQPTIWVHAVSVGEVLAVSRLLGELRAARPDTRVLLSTTTATGQALARQRLGAECCFHFPLDLPWAVRRYLRALRPAVLVLAESELWPNMLAQCRRRGVPVVVVNGRVSDRSLGRYLRLRWAWRPLLGTLARVLAQSEENARRFVAIGVPQERVAAAPNLKYDVRPPAEAEIVPLLRAMLPVGAPVLVCGSTLQEEEGLLLAAWQRVLGRVQDAVMILAPRHPERFPAVAELLRSSGVPWARRSIWGHAPEPLAAGSVLLLDSIGELASVYELATVAFVGGSLVNAGGHNPLEPAQLGIPVIMGPHYANFREIVEAMRQSEAIRLVSGDDLDVALRELLGNPEAARMLGQRGQAVWAREGGGTEMALRAVLALLPWPERDSPAARSEE